MKTLRNWLSKFTQFEINEDCTLNFYRNKGNFVKYKERKGAYQDNQDKIEKDRIEGLIQALIKDSNLWNQYICVNYNLDGKEESLYLQQGLRACSTLGKIDIYEYKDDTITFKETTKECDLSWMFKIPKTNFYSKETIEVNEEDKGGFVAKKYKERGAI